MHKSLIVLSVLAVAGCGGGATAVSSANATGNPSPGESRSSQQQAPGASGLLAAISGTTLQVQGATSQTAVTYSAGTRFTDTVAAKASDVVVGACVQVRSTPAANGAAGSPTIAPTAPPTAVTATSVLISAAVNGTCGGPGGGGGLGGGGGGRFNGGGGFGTPPSGFPGRRGRRFAGGATGLVTAVNGSTFTVASLRRGQGSTTPASTPVTVTVTTTPTTTYSRSAPATAAALKVGLCLTARGHADSTGTVAATLIALRPADNGNCAGTFGGGGGRGA